MSDWILDHIFLHSVFEVGRVQCGEYETVGMAHLIE
jgi:hypothetical protein